MIVKKMKGVATNKNEVFGILEEVVIQVKLIFRPFWKRYKIRRQRSIFIYFKYNNFYKSIKNIKRIIKEFNQNKLF